MKTVVSINQKIGQPNYGSFGASASFEMDLDQTLLGTDPQQVLSHCRLLGDLARAAVDRELDLQRRHGQEPAPAREPGDDDDEPPDEGPDPGTAAYNRQHPEQTRRPAPERGRQPYSQDDWERDEPEQRPRRGRPDNSRRSDDRGDNRGRGSDGPPRNGRQFLGWLGKQDRDVKDRAGRMAKNWNLPSLMKEWTDEEAMDMYHELTAKQESASHRNGSANGRSDRNGGY